MTKVEIIEETVAYYTENSDRRATNEHGGRQYLTSDNKMCAVGRCLINPSKLEYQSNQSVYGWSSYIDSMVDGGLNLDSELKEEYRGHDENFWKELQDFHDTPHYWKKDKTLSVNGEKYVQQLKDKYSVNNN